MNPTDRTLQSHQNLVGQTYVSPSLEEWLLERKISVREFLRKSPVAKEQLLGEFLRPVSSLQIADSILARLGRLDPPAVEDPLGIAVPPTAEEIATETSFDEFNTAVDLARERERSRWWLPWMLLLSLIGVGMLLKTIGVK